MKKTLLSLFIGTLLLTSCQATPPSPARTHPFVMTSFYPLYFITNEIALNKAEVLNITPSGKEPHSHKPSAKHLLYIEKESDLTIIQGNNFEPWAEGIKNNSFLEITTQLPLEETHNEDEHDHGEFDPHTWLDPVLMIETTKIIRDRLISIDPTNKETYTQNAQNLIARLEELHLKFQTELSSCQLNTFITSHDAFEYLAKRYNLEVKSISGISPFDEPSAKQLTELVKQAKEYKIKHVFLESLTSPETANTLATEANLTPLILNPISEQDYITMMEQNLENLKIGLQCQ